MLLALSRFLEKTFSNPTQNKDEGRKAIFFSGALLVLIPVICIIATLHFSSDQFIEALGGLAIAICMLIMLLVLKHLPSILLPFRVILIASMGLLSYELVIGGGGYALVWFYCFPASVYYILGRREGLYWIAGSVILTGVILMVPQVHDIYGRDGTSRFLLTYIIVTAISYAVETSRELHFSNLSREKTALEQAVKQIKTLRGLLPICASCKSIRDDRGYWNKLETYLDHHSEIKFSHGICPGCLKKLYPEEFDEMSESGEFPQLSGPVKREDNDPGIPE